MNTTRNSSLRSPAFFASLLASTALVAQAQLHWKAGSAAPGPTGSYPYPASVGSVVRWDPDGPGPRGEVLVFGGAFRLPCIGTTNLAWFDPATGGYGALGALDGTVSAIAVMPNGDLAIGGTFTSIDAQPARGVAIRSGGAWSALGGGVRFGAGNGGVAALQPLPNGDLVIGGTFDHAGTASASGLARWDGTQWSAIPYYTGAAVTQLLARANGNLIVAGAFPGTVAEWNGAYWQVYTGIGPVVYAMALRPNGDIVVAGGASYVNLWNGTAWTPIGGGVANLPHALLAQPNGDVLAATVEYLNGVFVHGVVRWDGTQWFPYAPRFGNVYAMATMPNGQFVVGGSPDATQAGTVRGLATWDGTAWHALANGFDGTVSALLPTRDRDLVALGTFTTTAGVATENLARWHAGAWQPDTDLGAVCGAVDDVGVPWVASQGSYNAPFNVYHLTAGSWVGYGTRIDNVVALAVAAGQPVAGCHAYPGYGPRCARWSGMQWVTLGNDLDGPVDAVRIVANGDVIAGGDFLFSGATSVSRIARFDGTAWQPLGPGVDGPVRALAELPNGELVIGGDFVNDGTLVRPLNLVARWDGTAWQPLGLGLGGRPGCSVRALFVLPDGSLLAGGDFDTADLAPAHGIARFDGVRWTPIDGGVDGTVSTIAQQLDGDIVVGGNFATAGGLLSAHFARLRSNRPAAADPFGSGCTGAVGPLVLAPTQLPWLGGSYRSIARGMSPSAVGLDLFGAASVPTPLSSLHPAGGPCLLLARPDAVTIRVPVDYTIESSVLVPRNAALLGLQMHQQLLVGEFTPLGLSQLGGTNGLVLTVGSL